MDLLLSVFLFSTISVDCNSSCRSTHSIGKSAFNVFEAPLVIFGRLSFTLLFEEGFGYTSTLVVGKS